MSKCHIVGNHMTRLIYTFRLCEVGSLEEPRDQTNVYQTGQVGIRHYPYTVNVLKFQTLFLFLLSNKMVFKVGIHKMLVRRP